MNLKKKLYLSIYHLKILLKSFENFFLNNINTFKLDRDPNIPYILFLLPKKNHWSTSYMNPELIDQTKVVREVSSKILRDSIL